MEIEGISLHDILFFLAAVCFFIKALSFRPKIVVTDFLALGFMFIAVALIFVL